jgi:transmembrane sensor
MNEQARDIELERLEAAASWLLRLRESPDDERLVAEWLDWCDDNGNLDAFQRVQDTWHTAGDVRPAEPQAATRQRRRRRPGHVFAQAAAVAAVLLGGAAVWTVMQPFGGETLSTEVAMHASSNLPDGSHIDLGALSRVRVKYSETERRLTLDAGEAFFEVAHDPERPFVVKAGDVTVTAVGTAFNVHRAGERVVVTVSEGRVRLQSDTGRIWNIVAPAAEPSVPVEAAAGEQAVYSKEEKRILTAAVADPGAATAWRLGVLKFVHEPLNVVISDLNRYSRRKIELGDPALRDLRYTGTVFNNSLEDWLTAVENVFPVQVKHLDDNRIVLEPLG